ncbi:MAG TPA: heme biosynthesis HemY N-terminal domain-containing protein [Gammaproteobacteria bacterium]
MKPLIVLIIALAIAAAVGMIAVSDSANIYITFSDWTIQSSLVLFVIIIILSFIVIYFSLRALFRMWNMPGNLRRWRRQRSQRLSERYLSKGLLSLVEGNWKSAEANLVKGAKYSETPLINYLCAARAAQREGRIDKRDHYISLAHADAPDSQVAIGLTQAELQINQKQTEQALATLMNLHEQEPDHGRVKLMLLKTYTELESWREVLALLPGLQKSGLLPKENIVATQLKAYAGLMKKAGTQSDREALESIWQKIPRNLKKELHLLEVYTSEKIIFNDTENCEPLLRKALKDRWDQNILRLYGLVEGKDAAKQLAFAESLYSSHARDPVLLLTLGRLSMQNGLWGKAASYLKDSIQIEPLPETYREFARLLERQGDYAAASSYYQHGLVLATTTQQEQARLIGRGEKH